MDCRDHFIAQVRHYLSMVDESYLIALTNKGIFNRALKDLEKAGEVQIKVEDTYIECTWGDGSRSTITEDIKTAQCSCPSRSICKHIVMSYWYVKGHMDTLFGVDVKADEEVEAVDFIDRLPRDHKMMIKAIGQKQFDEILYRLQFGVETEIEETGILTVRFIDEEITVKFPTMNPLRDSTCSCQSKEICRHKVEAVMVYQIKKGILTLDELRQNTSIDTEDRAKYKEALEEIRVLIEQILYLGLSRVPDTILEQITKTAVRCHSVDLPYLEKLLRDLGSELDLYLKKNAAASIQRMRKKIERIYYTVVQIEVVKDPVRRKDLIGEHKSDYFNIPPIELYGVGAEAWQSKSGYEGITYYFFSPKLREWLTYTHARPTYYDQTSADLTAMYKQNPPWELDCSSEQFSKAHIKLIFGKLSQEGRLSCSQQSKGELLGNSRMHLSTLRQIFIKDWERLFEQYEEKQWDKEEKQSENATLFVLEPMRWGTVHFDEVKQMLTLPIYDENECALYIVISFTPFHKKLIERVEKMGRMGRYPKQLLARVYAGEEQLQVFPIAGYYMEEILNWTLE